MRGRAPGAQPAGERRLQAPLTPAAVTDRDGHMLGIITIDDVLDVASKEATEDIQKIGGSEALDAPYLEVSYLQMVRKRGVWLSVLFYVYANATLARPPDGLVSSPPTPLRLDVGDAFACLRAAWLVWVTELRPLWRAGASAPQGSGARNRRRIGHARHHAGFRRNRLFQRLRHDGARAPGGV